MLENSILTANSAIEVNISTLESVYVMLASVFGYLCGKFPLWLM